MGNQILEGLEFMGDQVKARLKYCGKNVLVYPLVKIIRAERMEIDDYSRICDYVYIDAGKWVKIGKYCMITWHSIIEGGGGVLLGDRVFLGPATKLLTSTYEINGFYGNEFLPEGTRGFQYGDIIINDDAYIGANSVIMPGVTIGEGAVVGANSLVDRNLKPWGIYFGNPVKLIGMREQPSEDKKRIIESMDWTKHF